MDAQQNWTRLLNLLDRPAFLVRDGAITQRNAHAQARCLTVGIEIEPMLSSGAEEYRLLEEGSLCLTLRIGESVLGACVRQTEEGSLFLLDQQEDMDALRLLALAAQQLRGPLSDTMTAADQLLPNLRLESIPAMHRAAEIQQGLYRLLRIVGNMADAGQYLTSPGSAMEKTELNGFFQELAEKAGSLAQALDITVTYTGVGKPVVSLIDRQKMERAVYNLLSNALRFTPKGGCIQVSLTIAGSRAVLRILDSGEGLSQEIQDSLFDRYRRSPTIEDGRYGLGLGLLLVRQAAANHGGALLISPGQSGGTLAALSFMLRSEQTACLRSPVRSVDYAGELDHGLVELSRELPRSAFDFLNLS